MEKEKEYTFKTARGGRGPRSYKKTESKLAVSEINLLLGDLVHTYNSMPRIVQISFLQLLTNEMTSRKPQPTEEQVAEVVKDLLIKDAESNEEQSREVEMESTGLSESGAVDTGNDLGRE